MMSSFRQLLGQSHKTNQKDLHIDVWKALFFVVDEKSRTKLTGRCYSMASRYTDLDNARFWIGSKKIWDARIYVVRALRCTNFWAARFFLSYTIVCFKKNLGFSETDINSHTSIKKGFPFGQATQLLLCNF